MNQNLFVVFLKDVPDEIRDLLSDYERKQKDSQIYHSLSVEWNHPMVHLELVKTDEEKEIPYRIQIRQELVLCAVDISLTREIPGFHS